LSYGTILFSPGNFIGSMRAIHGMLPGEVVGADHAQADAVERAVVSGKHALFGDALVVEAVGA
jgi:hypothetical protein